MSILNCWQGPARVSMKFAATGCVIEVKEAAQTFAGKSINEMKRQNCWAFEHGLIFER